MPPSPAQATSQGRSLRLLLASIPHDPIVQPRDGVERGEDGPLLPSRKRGGVLAGERDPPVDLAQIVIMRGARLLAPVAAATPFSNSALYCGWIMAPNSTVRSTRSAGVIAVNS